MASEDEVEPGCGLSCAGAPWKGNWKFNCKCRGRRSKKAEVPLDQRPALTLDEAVLALRRHRKSFLKKVEREVRELISHKRKKACTGVVGVRPSGQRQEYTAWSSDWRRRVWTMMWHKDGTASEKPSLPVYAKTGETLDSVLSAPIVAKVEQVHAEFMAQHGNIINKHVMDRIRENPQIQLVIAQYTVSTLRHAIAPLTEELYKAMLDLIQQYLSGQIIGARPTGDVLMQILSDATLAAFTTALLHTFHGTLGKVVLKTILAGTIHSTYTTGGTLIAKAAITGMVTTGGTALAAHGSGLVAGAPVLVFLAPIVLGIVWWQVHRFPRKMGRKVAKKVKKIMKGDFDERNRTAIQLIVEDTLRDNARQLCKGIVHDEVLAETLLAAAREVIKEKHRAEAGRENA